MLEAIKKDNLVITIPGGYCDEGIQRLMVEIFIVEPVSESGQSALYFFDVGWPECDGGNPIHYYFCDIEQKDDFWLLKNFEYYDIDYDYDDESDDLINPRLVTRSRPLTGKVEIFDPEKHPDLAGNDASWTKKLKHMDKEAVKEMKERAAMFFERDKVGIIERLNEFEKLRK